MPPRHWLCSIETVRRQGVRGGGGGRCRCQAVDAHVEHVVGARDGEAEDSSCRGSDGGMRREGRQPENAKRAVGQQHGRSRGIVDGRCELAGERPANA